MYDKIVVKYNKDKVYIQNTKPYNTQECLLSKIKNIEEQQLSLAEGLPRYDSNKSHHQSNQVSQEFPLEEGLAGDASHNNYKQSIQLSKSEVPFDNKNTQKVKDQCDQFNGLQTLFNRHQENKETTDEETKDEE